MRSHLDLPSKAGTEDGNSLRAGINRQPLHNRRINAFKRSGSFKHELKIEALLPADAPSHQTAILHLAPSLGVGFFSKRSLQIAVLLIDQDFVLMPAPVKGRCLRLELQSGFVGFAFNAVQSPGMRLEPGPAPKPQLVSADRLKNARGNLLSFVDAQFLSADRLKNARGNLLSFVDAQFFLAAAALAMAGNDGMEVILSQPVLTIQSSKGICPFFAFGHAAGFLPGRILAHLLQLSECSAECGIVQTASILKLAHDRTPLMVVCANGKLDNETGSIHTLNGSAKSAFLPALKCGASCGSNL